MGFVENVVTKFILVVVKDDYFKQWSVQTFIPNFLFVYSILMTILLSIEIKFSNLHMSIEEEEQQSAYRMKLIKLSTLILDKIGSPACHSKTQSLLVSLAAISYFLTMRLRIGALFQYSGKIPLHEHASDETKYRTKVLRLIRHTLISIIKSNQIERKRLSRISTEKFRLDFQKSFIDQFQVISSFLNQLDACRPNDFQKCESHPLWPVSINKHHKNLSLLYILISFCYIYSNLLIYLYIMLVDPINQCCGNNDNTSRRLLGQCPYATSIYILLALGTSYQTVAFMMLTLASVQNSQFGLKIIRQKTKHCIEQLNSRVELEHMKENIVEDKHLEFQRNKIYARQVRHIKFCERLMIIIYIQLVLFEYEMRPVVNLVNKLMSRFAILDTLIAMIIIGMSKLMPDISRPLIQVVVLAFNLDILLLFLTSFNKQCDELIGKDLLSITAHCMKLNDEIVKQFNCQLPKNNENEVGKQTNHPIKITIEIIEPTNFREGNIESFRKQINDNSDEFLFTDFSTMQQSVLNPFFMKQWHKKLQHLDLVSHKLSLKTFNINLNYRVLIMVSVDFYSKNYYSNVV